MITAAPQIQANISYEDVRKQGFPKFNDYPHTLIDLSDSKVGHTISVKLPNGDFVTFCCMAFPANEGCIDIQYHGQRQQVMLGFSPHHAEKFGTKLIHNLYSLNISNQ